MAAKLYAPYDSSSGSYFSPFND